MILLTINKKIRDKHLEHFKSNKNIVNQLENIKSKIGSLSVPFICFDDKRKTKIFLTYLINNIDDILIGNTERLNQIITRINRLKIDFNIPVDIDGTSDITLKEKLLTVFDYDLFSTTPQSITLESARTWSAYQLVNLLQSNVCPYCNRNFTHTYYSKEGKVRPELDHFYYKDKYPYLAVSLYNLVPSCSICNSSLKGKKDFYTKHHIHPYKEGFGSKCKFTLSPLKDNDIGGRDGYDLEFTKGQLEAFNIEFSFLENDNEFEERVQNSNDTFKILELYEFHKDYLLELIQKSKIYNQAYTKWISSKYMGTIFNDEDEIQRMIAGNYLREEEWGKRILSKLTSDICDELKLFR